MGILKRAVMVTVVLLACAGVYTALTNMPIVSGCAFYSDCPKESAEAETPTVASMETNNDVATP